MADINHIESSLSEHACIGGSRSTLTKVIAGERVRQNLCVVVNIMRMSDYTHASGMSCMPPALKFN